MPNYCYIKITVTGKNLPLFKNTLVNNSFSFEQIVPTDNKNPEDAWGTTSDMSDAKLKITKTKVEIIGSTSWSLPTAWATNCLIKIKNIKIVIAYVYEEGPYGLWECGSDINVATSDDISIMTVIPTGKLSKFIKKNKIRIGNGANTFVKISVSGKDVQKLQQHNSYLSFLSYLEIKGTKKSLTVTGEYFGLAPLHQWALMATSSFRNLNIKAVFANIYEYGTIQYKTSENKSVARNFLYDRKNEVHYLNKKQPLYKFIKKHNIKYNA